MNISFNWLREFVAFQPRLTIEDIAWRLTEATATIEKIHRLGQGLEKVVVGELMETRKHPDADTLSIGKVKISPKESIQVIYGQMAVVAKGDRIPVAIAPCELPVGKIEARKIRGVFSEGMLCLDSELMKGAPETLTKFDRSIKVGTPVADLLGLNDQVFEIDNHSLTHRPDLFSHNGFARECVALGLGKWKKQIKDDKPERYTGKKVLPLEPTFENKRCSKNYYATVVSGVSAKPSPAWITSRLQALGIRPINAIVDITNLVMLEIGQPCHAFDLRPLKNKKFIHRLSKKGETMITLDGVKRTLEEDIIVVEVGEQIVDLCGIMGGENSSIQEDTSDIYFHCCHYDAVLIRKAMMGLGHRTDAGTIFEKNIEPERAKIAFLRSLQLFREVFPEADFEFKTFHHQQELSPKKKIFLASDKIRNLIGIEIPASKVQRILADLGFKVQKKGKGYEVTVPVWRTNSITLQEDLVEEVARINGYSQIPALPPSVELVRPIRHHKRHINHFIRSLLTLQGFQEELNFSFLSRDLLEKAGITDHTDLIEIANPVSEDFQFMRPSLLPYLLKNLSRNQLLEARTWKTFEIGTIFTRNEDEALESSQLTLLNSSTQGGNAFFESKGVLESLFRELSLGYELLPADHCFAHPNRCLSIISDERIIGHCYELHPALVHHFKLKGVVVALECHLHELYQLKSIETFYREINRNPVALLDINVVVHATTLMSHIENIIRSVEPQYLKKAELIDLYEGQQIGAGKKSLTFSLSYQHPERTFKETEIQSMVQELIKRLEAAGGVVRR